ncbi:MAG: TetR/AcrR family transcriptional regulator [Pseudonocardiaceae bacterium]
MTESARRRVAARREAVEREILDASWQLMEREGVAALNVREVARAIGLRQQSLTYYFPTKRALLDALFADGFVRLGEVFDALPDGADPVDAVVAVGDAVAEYFSAHPARYHLMFQRTVPGFRPSEGSHAVALRSLQMLIDRLAAAGVTKPDDVALVRGVISGLASEQLANEPGGRQYISQVERGVRAVLAALAPSGGSARRRA